MCVCVCFLLLIKLYKTELCVCVGGCFFSFFPVTSKIKRAGATSASKKEPETKQNQLPKKSQTKAKTMYLCFRCIFFGSWL